MVLITRLNLQKSNGKKLTWNKIIQIELYSKSFNHFSQQNNILLENPRYSLDLTLTFLYEIKKNLTN